MKGCVLDFLIALCAVGVIVMLYMTVSIPIESSSFVTVGQH